MSPAYPALSDRPLAEDGVEHGIEHGIEKRGAMAGHRRDGALTPSQIDYPNP
jgi:hypothetical protein